jgi:hypothetical protein
MPSFYDMNSFETTCPRCGKVAQTGKRCPWCGQSMAMSDGQAFGRIVGGTVKFFGISLVLGLGFGIYQECRSCFGGHQTSTETSASTSRPNGSTGVSSVGETSTMTQDSSAPTTIGTEATTWDTDPREHRGERGRFTYHCSPKGAEDTVYGSGPYTDDSSVCTAAVHAGKITLSQGGTVTIEMRPGLSSYKGSTRHGIEARSYDSWPGSFVFVP